MPVLENKSIFHAPALYDQQLRIVTQIKERPTVRIKFHYQIFNNEEKLINEGETLLVFADKRTGKPCRPPEVFQKILAPFF